MQSRDRKAYGFTLGLTLKEALRASSIGERRGQSDQIGNGIIDMSRPGLRCQDGMPVVSQCGFPALEGLVKVVVKGVSISGDRQDVDSPTGNIY